MSLLKAIELGALLVVFACSCGVLVLARRMRRNNREMIRLLGELLDVHRQERAEEMLARVNAIIAERDEGQ